MGALPYLPDFHCTGSLPCVKIEIGGADCVDVATTKRMCVEHGMHAGSSSI